ncbi:MAG: enoyl-CoA hydratase/isomerase family protein [bacterium]|nr:enoyl-CoA hydratase/isomerase family protein [Acidimicrobiia bacterium]MCY4649802.1 enoyl-CoA hydratase/isomerase family protein [bacterium]
MTDSVTTTYEGSLARILLNRPDRRNALDERTGEDLSAAVEEVSGRDDLAVVVLEGAGDHFCAGWDLSEFGRLSAADDDQVASYLVANVHLLRRIADLPQFTVAFVQGYAIGFGAALAVSADLAVADPGARFYFPEAEFGLVPAVVLPPLVESLGVRAALLSTLTAAPIPADHALGMGMVGMVADAGEREGLVTRLTKLSPGVVRSTKRLAAEVATAPAAEVDRMVAETGVATLRSEEARRILGEG